MVFWIDGDGVWFSFGLCCQLSIYEQPKMLQHPLLHANACYFFAFVSSWLPHNFSLKKVSVACAIGPSVFTFSIDFSFQNLVLGIYLNFQGQKSLVNQYLPHSESKTYHFIQESKWVAVVDIGVDVNHIPIR